MAYRDNVMMVLRNSKGEFLLAHKTNAPEHEWYFPGGGIEKKESLLQAFYREVEEELGLKKNDFVHVEPTFISHTYDWNEELVKRTGYKGQRQTTVIGTLKPKAIVNTEITKELDGIKWVTYDGLFSIIPFEDLKQTVLKLNEVYRFSKTRVYAQLYETDFWKVILLDDQAYLGRCVIELKRRCKEMSLITDEEWVDFYKNVVRKLERVFKKSFNATMFNWTCLMNDAYKEKEPKPQVHWHFWPRYQYPAKVGRTIFEDKEFAHHYSKERKNIVSQDMLDKIAKVVKRAL